MKQEPSYFEGQESVLIYIAKKLKEALLLEALLTDAGVDFGAEADEYRAGVIFRSVRAGAFFYVLPEIAEAARRVLMDAGYHPYEGDPAALT